jgi:hypothetical protein
VTESPRGFEDGSTSKSVTVPGDGYIEVPFDLGGRYSQVYATVSWNTDADIDQGLTIDGSEEDSDASSQYSLSPARYRSQEAVPTAATSGSRATARTA